MKYLISIVVAFALSGCMTTVELGAQMYKACIVKSQDGCPTDRIGEWVNG
tara:strand:+ start:323 stop:472 length:150 start_codon:yes stop_codon:yes gene_type:complete